MPNDDHMSATLTASEQKQEIHRIFRIHHQTALNMVRSSYGERREKLERINRYLQDERNLARLFAAMQQDLNKPEAEVIATEVGVVQAHINYVLRRLRRWMRPQPVSTPLPLIGTRSYIHYEPKGASLIIAPWNYPLNLAIVPLVYALAAGNTAILKPSEISSHTSAFITLMISELFDESEVAVFEGDASVAQELLDLPFHHIFFTGSPRIGKIVMGAAAQHLSTVTLELGGKSPIIIDETASISTMARRTAWGKLINKGQTCIAPDYLLLHESIYEEFIREFQKAAQSFYDPQGEGMHRSPDYCRIINQRHFRRLKDLFDDAVAKGAEVLTGGQFDEADRFIAPTLLTKITEDMDIMQEEIFGPLLPVLTYRDPQEAVNHIRQRPKPLTLYIGSRKQSNIDFYLRETSAGGTVINDLMLGYSNPSLPFGGVNNSGVGKSFGHHGFVEFSNERGVIHRRWGTLRFIYPPYSKQVKNLLKLLYRWI